MKALLGTAGEGPRSLSSLSDTQAFVDALRHAADNAELALLLEQISRDMGFRHYALVDHVDFRITGKAGVVWLINYPSDWMEVFLEEKLYISDPVLLTCQHTNAAFAWSDMGEMIRLTDRHRDVLKAAAIEGLGDGLTMPAHVPGQVSGSCNFAVRTGRDLPRQHLGMVQLVGAFAFQRARTLALADHPGAGPAGRVALTPRQLDCIALVGRGKSDWEIARILGLKEDTVTEYLDAARARYGVARRIQLVMRAVHDGHLALSDLL